MEDALTPVVHWLESMDNPKKSRRAVPTAADHQKRIHRLVHIPAGSRVKTAGRYHENMCFRKQ